MTKDIYDVAVLGGGASGMMAGIQAAQLGADTVILEGNECLGKKILATGNGKCNLTNQRISEQCYYGADAAFLQRVLQGFTLEDTLDFFEDIGVAPVEQEGYYYPRCRQAGAVVALLRERLLALSVPVMLETRVRSISKDSDNLFTVTHTGGRLRCKKVILATGGKASAIKGSNGDGYYYAKMFGHNITPLVPALVQLHTNHPGISAMAGARCDCRLSLFVQGECVGEESGELQLTDYGISGIAVFQLSRMASIGLERNMQVEMSIDFMPEYTKTDVEEILLRRFEYTPVSPSVKQALWGLLNDKVIEGVLMACGISTNQSVKDCDREEIVRLRDILKSFIVPITKTHGFKHAQVTAGGVSTDDICPDTMESLLCPGFYMAGEIVDVDGICGGYNLQWAWSSGAVAGRHAAKDII
ncbi:MAG: NAD(P)/FAD-dependent oxidoreductase [Lachnospiraceae bacterium]|nr:NAD(P)/FAD-dependent oxidoreductase [Lachnospiraceae bacterium]